jgi:hypothetical protein
MRITSVWAAGGPVECRGPQDGCCVRAVQIVKERSNFNRCVAARWIQPDDSDVEVLSWLGRHWDVERSLGIGQLQAHPAGAIVDPVRCHDVAARQAEQPRQCVAVDRLVTDHRRGCEGGARISDADLDQAGAALLDDHSRLLGDTAGVKPRGTRLECRVASEWLLCLWLEDAHPIVRSGPGRIEEERCFGQVRPTRDCPHFPGRHIVGIIDNGDRVAGEGTSTTDVNLAERVCAHATSPTHAAQTPSSAK